jgi:hypothetical protein
MAIIHEPTSHIEEAKMSPRGIRSGGVRDLARPRSIALSSALITSPSPTCLSITAVYRVCIADLARKLDMGCG